MRNLLKQQHGYTIIELLAVISILVVISGIISGILFSTLRGSNKTRVLTEVSQNGNYVTSYINNVLIDSNAVTEINGEIIPDDLSDCTASPSGATITVKRLDGTSTAFACEDVGGVYTITADDNSLVDTQVVAVEEGSCAFFCSQKSDDSYSTPIVGVSFGLEGIISDASESQGSGTFNTSISLRNFSP